MTDPNSPARIPVNPTDDDPPPGTRMARVKTLKLLGFYGTVLKLDPPEAPAPVSVGGLAIFDAADLATLAVRRARLGEPRVSRTGGAA